MSSKTEVLNKIIPTQSYVGSHIRSLINDITCENDATIPTTLRKGDVIRVRIQKDGTGKARPSIIIKVTKEYVVSIPLTSCENENTLMPSTGSRFFKDCYFCNAYIITAKDVALRDFLGVYENMQLLNTAIKELRRFIDKNI